MKISYKLKASEVSAAKPKNKLYKLFDGGGLFLRVQPSGLKCWYYQYRVAGQVIQYKLGEYPQVTLSAARDKHKELVSMVADGIDPRRERERLEEEERQKRLAKVLTFRRVLDEWISFKVKEDITEKTLRSYEGWLKPVVEVWADKPYAEIRLSDIRKLLDALLKRGWATANSVAGVLGQIGRFARVQGLHQYNAFDGIKDLLPRRPVSERDRHFTAATSVDEFRQVLGKIDRYIENGGIERITALFLLLIVYLPQRRFELLKARWTEVDFEGGRIVKNREGTKDRQSRTKAFVIYLSPQAVAILRELEGFRSDEWLFPSYRRKGAHLSEGAVTAAMQRAGLLGVQSLHGLRASFATIMADQCGHDCEDLIQACLGHEGRDRVARCYSRGDYEADRRKLIEYWGCCVDAMRTGKELPQWGG